MTLIKMGHYVIFKVKSAAAYGVKMTLNHCFDPIIYKKAHAVLLFVLRFIYNLLYFYFCFHKKCIKPFIASKPNEIPL